MVQADSPDGGKNALQPQKNVESTVIYVPRTWPAVVVTVTLLAAAGGGVAALLYFSKAIPDVAVAYSFIAQNGLSLFVFLAVVAQACIYWGQRNLMLRQWEAMQDALTETRKQSAFAGKSLKANRRHTVYTLRAYVSVRQCIASFPGEIVLEIVNFGQTPAHKVQFAHAVVVRKAKDVPETVIETVDWHSQSIPGIPMAPTMSSEKRLGIPALSDSDVTSLTAGTHKLFLTGAIRYTDIFRRVRHTRFCFAYNWGTRRMDICIRGNSAT